MFEEELIALENKIKNKTAESELIAFYGSSSIRLWNSLSQDLAPFKSINLGFGGSTIQDCTRQAERVLYPLNPAKIYFYAGDNDIGNEASTVEVFQRFQTFFHNTVQALPKAEVVFVSIKPSPQRAHYRSTIESANMMIQEFMATQDNSDFLNIYDAMILPDGKIDSSLFIEDNLHLNEKGYQLWTKLFRESLEVNV